jgi:hypothetical protein
LQRHIGQQRFLCDGIATADILRFDFHGVAAELSLGVWETNRTASRRDHYSSER